jgi:isopentenyldiphosphate isomerase
MTEEYLDICDAAGRPRGVAVPRDEAHRNGLWHRTVHIWIANGSGMVLFQQRALSKESFPGVWDVSAAGHISAGERELTAAQRELFQELGVQVAESELECLFTTQTSSVQQNGSFLDKEFNSVYLVQKDVPLSELIFEPSEVSRAQFFPIQKLSQLAENGAPDFAPHPEEYSRLFEHLIRIEQGPDR